MSTSVLSTSEKRSSDEASSPSTSKKKERQLFIPLPRQVVVKTAGTFPHELKDKFVKVCKVMDPKDTGELNHSDICKALALSASQYVIPPSADDQNSKKSPKRASESFLQQKTINDIMKRYPADGNTINYRELIKTVEHSFEESYKPYDPSFLKKPNGEGTLTREYQQSDVDTKLKVSPLEGHGRPPRQFVSNIPTMQQGVSIVNENGEATVAPTGELYSGEDPLPRDLEYIRRSLLESTTPKRLFNSFYNYDLNKEGKLDETSFLHVLSSHGVYLDKSMVKKVVNIVGDVKPEGTAEISTSPIESSSSQVSLPSQLPTSPEKAPPVERAAPSEPAPTSTKPPSDVPFDRPAKTIMPQHFQQALPTNISQYIYGPLDPYKPQRADGFYQGLRESHKRTVELKNASSPPKTIDYEKFLKALQLPTTNVESVENLEKIRTQVPEGGKSPVQDSEHEQYLPLGNSNWKASPLNIHPIQRGRGFAPLYNTTSTIQVDGSTYSVQQENDVINNVVDPATLLYSTPSNVPAAAKYSLAGEDYQKIYGFRVENTGHSIKTPHRNASLDIIGHTDAVYDSEAYDMLGGDAVSSHGYSGKKHFHKSSTGSETPLTPPSPSKPKGKFTARYAAPNSVADIVQPKPVDIPESTAESSSLGTSQTPEKKVKEGEKSSPEDIYSPSAPHSGKKTNHAAADRNYIRTREVINWGEKSSSQIFDNSNPSPVEERLRANGRIDDDGNPISVRKNYGWANASRPVLLLSENAYTKDPERASSPVASKGQTVNPVIKNEPVPTLTSSPPSIVPPSSVTERGSPGRKLTDVDTFYERANLKIYSGVGAKEPPVTELHNKKLFSPEGRNLNDNVKDLIKGGVPTRLYDTFDPQYGPPNRK